LGEGGIQDREARYKLVINIEPQRQAEGIGTKEIKMLVPVTNMGASCTTRKAKKSGQVHRTDRPTPSAGYHLENTKPHRKIQQGKATPPQREHLTISTDVEVTLSPGVAYASA